MVWMGGSQTRSFPRSPDGDNNHAKKTIEYAIVLRVDFIQIFRVGTENPHVFQNYINIIHYTLHYTLQPCEEMFLLMFFLVTKC